MKAGNHRWHERVPPNSRKIERETGSVSEDVEKTELRSAVAFPERMDRVQFGKEVGDERHELLFGPTPRIWSAV